MYITNPIDMTEDFNQSECKPYNAKKSICFGCGILIHDQFILRVAPDLEWHAKCLKCYECGQYLDENCTCFVRNGKTYCKLDYVRLFSKKCFKCKESFTKSDFVMKANNRIYHLECFRCLMCNKPLAPGDEFALKDDGLVCKYDIDAFEKSPSYSNTNPIMNNSCQNITNLQPIINNTNQSNLNNKPLIKCEDLPHNDFENNQDVCLSPNGMQQTMGMMNCMSHMSQIPPMHTNSRLMNAQIGSLNSSSASNSSTGSNSNSGSNPVSSMHRKDKTTRVRTVLNEKQLHTLRTCYGANPRPDALMKEQLVEMTGLSPRVIRVWFQNKRCKDKKKTILIKQMQEQQKNRQSIGHGIQMVATSPMRNDIGNLGPGSQVEIQQSANAYQNSLGWNLHGMGDMGQMGQYNHSNYDQMMGFGSDEEDCFDQMSDQGGDDSVSSVGGLDDTRIQQL
ncbi:unnamed protein product [Brachionus calyciflorus]|uniref:Islet n=1 Tax=Brachionus calyciflorus TaxID=104777 RepID=A0A813U228_9BILA|nr:unnamed protein product [Brachionus calyciflorus]